MSYKSCVTFGRFNIPHSGHVQLIEKMLSNGEQALVYISTGAVNNTWDLRVSALRALCRRSQLSMSRISFLKAKSPFGAVKKAIDRSEFGETALVLGEDQFLMGVKLSSDLDVPLILNKRTFSSTNVRFLLSRGERESLSSCYQDPYVMRLTELLYREELNRERSSKVTTETYSSSASTL